MPTVGQNLSKWGETYGWTDGGDEWSTIWGGPEAQWYFVIYPRIHRFLPANKVLEIAPGHGRWTQFLRDHSQRFTGVDLSPGCVEACKQRFADWPEAAFHVNDGYSLSMVPDSSIDFAFSFDSLVHAEWDVVAGYLQELSRVLAPDGVAFLHHSHMGVHVEGIAARLTARAANHHWRALSVSGPKVEEECRRLGLACISQERTNWGADFLSDCMSIVVRADSSLARDCVVVDNPDFMRDAAYVADVSRPYVGGVIDPAKPAEPQPSVPKPTVGRGSFRGLVRLLVRR